MTALSTLQPAELAQCADLIARIPFFAPYFSRDQIAAALSKRPETHRILVERAAPDTPIRGLCWFDPRGHLSRGGYLRLLAVDPAAQGQGVAGRLLIEAEAQVFAVSSAFFLMVNVNNEPARAFYRRCGYAELGVLPDYAVAGQDELLMWKSRPV